MSTNKYSKFVVDSIVLGTPIGSLTAAGGSINDIEGTDLANAVDGSLMVYDSATSNWVATTDILVDSGTMTADFFVGDGSQLTNVSGALDSDAVFEFLSYRVNPVGTNQKQVAISLNTLVDPFDQTGTDDRAFNLNYTSTTGFYVRENAGRTELHADASGSGLSTGMLLTGAAFSETGTEIAGNVKLSGLPTSDPAEAGLLWNDGGIPVFSGSTAPSGGAGIDSADVISIVDAPYVQARQTPQDFAYSSLTGAPTALSSFTNDTNYITAADIPATVDSDYVQARVTLDGVGLDSAGVTALVDSDYVAARAPAGGGLEGFDVSQYDSATSNGIFEYNVSGGGQKQLLFSLNTAVAPIPRSDATLDNQVNYTLSTNHQFGFKDAGGFRTEVYGRAAGTTASTGLVLTGPTFNNSGVELVGNVKLSSLPTSDPSEAGLLWNDGGIPVFSGSTAPTGGGGGLDSAAVQGVVDDNLLGGVSNTGVVIGPSASADTSKLQMTVVGPSAFTNGAYNVAIGRSASVQSGEEFAVAIGNQARAGFSTGGLGGVSIGSQSTVQYDYGVAVGMLAEVKNLNGVALGYQAEVTGSIGIAIGSNALTTQTNGVAIGKGATASQVNSIAIGGDNNTFARSLASICIGEDADNADATNNYSIVIGKDASVTGTNNPDTVTIGRASRAGGSYAIGLGYLSRADAENALVINASGTNREVTSQYGIDIRTSAAGSLTYDTTNDWTFGAGVTMTDLTASGATVVFSNLPTTDPVNAGQLWNDGGTLKVSAG